MGGGEGIGMGVEVAINAEGEIVSGAAGGGRSGGAVVTDRGSGVLTGEGIGGMDVTVAGEAEARGVRAAVDSGGGRLAAGITRHTPSPRADGATAAVVVTHLG